MDLIAPPVQNEESGQSKKDVKTNGDVTDQRINKKRKPIMNAMDNARERPSSRSSVVSASHVDFQGGEVDSETSSQFIDSIKKRKNKRNG